MRELAVQATNDTYVTADRSQIQLEISQLKNEINRIASQTEFNTKKLLTGKASNVVFQVGANSGQVIKLSIKTMNASALGVNAINVVTAKASVITGKIDTINSAINKVSSQRAKLGSYQNRLEHTIANLNTSSENLQAAESRIRTLIWLRK